MPVRRNLFCIAIGLLYAGGAARGQDATIPHMSAPAAKTTPAINSKAVANFYKRLQTAKTIEFTATYYARSTTTLGFLQMNTYTVQAQRPNLFAVRGNPALMRVAGEGDTESLEFLSNLLNVSASDGKTMLQFDTRTHGYEKSSAPSRFSDAEGAMQSVKPDIALNTDMLAGFAPAPDEDVWRRLAIVFVQNHTNNPRGLEVEKLYFAADTGELLRYSSFFQYQFRGTLKEQERVEYSDWKFNARLPRNTFTFTLPADARQIPPVVARMPAGPVPEKH